MPRGLEKCSVALFFACFQIEHDKQQQVLAKRERAIAALKDKVGALEAHVVRAEKQAMHARRYMAKAKGGDANRELTAQVKTLRARLAALQTHTHRVESRVASLTGAKVCRVVCWTCVSALCICFSLCVLRSTIFVCFSWYEVCVCVCGGFGTRARSRRR